MSTVVESTKVFFDALTAADRRVVEREDLELAAAFAPPVTSSAACCCGSTLEIRARSINPTSDERQAAAEAVNDLLTRDSRPTHLEIVAAVIDAINRERDHDHHQAMEDFIVDHDSCRDLW